MTKHDDCDHTLIALQPPDASYALAGWILALSLQALPYAAAVACAGLSGLQGTKATADPA